MKLVYLYIHSLYGDINVDFNLGSDYYFFYDHQKRILKVERNNHYISNFFTSPNDGDRYLSDVQINAIVGSNGTGKTSILEAIRQLLAKRYDGDYVLIYESDNDYLYVSNKKFKIESELLRFNLKEQSHPKLETIYYSNILDVRLFNTNNEHYWKRHNYTTNFLLAYSFSANNMMWQDLKWQMTFVKQFKGEQFTNRFKVPRQIAIKVNPNRAFPETIKLSIATALKGLLKYEFIEMLFKDFYQSKMFLENKRSRGFYINYTFMITYFYFNSIFTMIDEKISTQSLARVRLNKSLVQTIQTISEHLENKGELSFKYLNEQFLACLTIGDTKYANKFNKQEVKIQLDQLHESCLNLLEILDHSAFKKVDTYTLTVDFSDIDLQTLNIFENVGSLNLLALEWYELSSGQFAQLNMFSRLYAAKMNSDALEQSKLWMILIDEGELYFHPQWQKEWVKTIVNGINRIFEDCIATLQIIVTTHSPFLLSDIPSDRILFLEEIGGRVISRRQIDDMPLTFGANIHQLYAHTFFLTDGLMGSFAKDKINHVADRIIQANDEEFINEIVKLQKEIMLIGEPLIKGKLVDMFEQRKKLITLTYQQRELDVQTLKNQVKDLSEVKDLRHRVEKLEALIKKLGDTLDLS